MKKIIFLLILLACTLLTGCIRTNEDVHIIESTTELNNPEVEYTKLKNQLDKDYQTAVRETEAEYDEVAQECLDAIEQLKESISDYRFSYSTCQNSYESRISSLERERENAYGEACAQTGGRPNSYAQSVRQQYDSKIRSLESQMQSELNSYTQQISKCNSQISQCEDLYERILGDKEAALSQLDAWYSEEVNKLKETYGIE